MSAEENIEDLLPDYAAGELSQAEAGRVEAALEGSPQLREELARYERMFVLLAAAAAEEVKTPFGFRSGVMGRIVVESYLAAAANLARSLLGDYGRALIYYLRLS